MSHKWNDTSQPTYEDGIVKQSFKDETDIRQIMQRAQKSGTISHLAKNQAFYSDFAEFNFFDAQLMIARGQTIFDELPSRIREEFNNNQQAFYEYVNDPANKDDLEKKLPLLAEPGFQLLDSAGKNVPEALIGAPPDAPTPAEPAAAKEAETPPTVPST